MESVEKMETPSETAVPSSDPSLIEEQMFGTLDVVIILGVLLITVYFIFFKKKKEAEPVKSFSIEPNTFAVSDSSFITKMKSTGRSIIVFYGSQTGTAEEFATRLAKEASRYKLKAMVADPEEYDMEDLAKVSEIENSLAIFCVATYGEGDPTDNAQDFYQWLQSGDADLNGLNFAVFGLGNKTYEHYNSMGKYVDKRLEELGAVRVFELGLGDDDANIEEDFISWKERFWSAVCENFHIESFGEDINLRQYQLVTYEEPPASVFTGEVARMNSYKTQKPPFDPKNPFLSSIIVNRELYKGERSCMHIELDISGAKLRYDAGDHVAVYPTNDSVLVEEIGKLLDANLDAIFSLNNLDEDSSKKHPFPCPTTYRTALQHYVDITSIPRTHVLKEIAEYATDEEDKKKLKMMGTSTEEGKHMYLTWVVKDHRSIIHILKDMPSLKPPLDHLLELLPRLQPRYYSISSSPKIYPTTVHVTAVLVQYETPTKRVNTGVATGWFKTLLPTEEEKPKVPVFIRRSQFRLPSKSLTPIIMIGPGTGVAPFRGFIQERAFQKNEGKPVGETILYFGCRKEKEDFLYQDELKQYLADGVLTKMYLAFSRDQPEKVYITHLLKKNKEEIWKVIEQNGHIYVCGDARSMAKDVHNIILDVIKEFGQKTESEAEAFLKKMESQRRYSADVWG